MNTRQSNRASAGSQNQSAGSSASPAQSTAVAAHPKLMTIFAEQYGIEPNKMVGILRSTAFNTGKTNGQPNPPATDEEIASLIVIANQYHLNPFLKEIYAFRNKGGGITPIVGYDGWIRLVQAQPTFQGEEFEQGYDEALAADGKPKGLYFECSMWRSDRVKPTKVREYLFENYRPTEPWDKMCHRMLRMRSYIQCARVCFGFGGIYDHDEGEKIANTIDITPREGSTKPATRAPREISQQRSAPALEHQTAQTLEQTSFQQPETVSAGDPGQADAFRSLASEPAEFPPEDEAGTRL